jgi:hypothetical protein
MSGTPCVGDGGPSIEASSSEAVHETGNKQLFATLKMVCPFCIHNNAIATVHRDNGRILLERPKS